MEKLKTNKAKLKKTKSTPWIDCTFYEKVDICEQGRGNENNLLQSYRLIFLALGTTMLIVPNRMEWGILSGGWFGFGGILLSILWLHTCHKRSGLVDDWEVILAELWREANVIDIENHYRGAKTRIADRQRLKDKRLGTLRTWFFPLFTKGRFRSRTVFNVIAPSILLFLSGYIVIRSLFFAT